MFVKVTCNSQTRKFKLADGASIQDLEKELVRCFGEIAKTFDIAYKDDEEELIKVTNQEEWEICTEEFSSKVKQGATTTIILNLTQKAAVNAQDTMTNDSFYIPNNDDSNSDAMDWNIIEKPTEVKSPMNEESTKPQPSIFESQVQEEATKQPEDTLPHFTNESQDDIVIDMKINGTPEDLKRIEQTIIHKFAPMAGFCIDQSVIEVKKQSSINEESFMNQSNLSSVSQDMKNEIEQIIENKFKALSESIHEKPKSSNRGFDHGCVYCDHCAQRISFGCRYKSMVKPDFDLCETCEAKGVHPEPLIKIRQPLGPQIGQKLNVHFETLKNLISEVSTRACPYAQKKNEFEKKAQPTLCHIRKSVEKTEAAPKCPEMEKKTEQSNLKVGLCHIRQSKPAGPTPVEQTSSVDLDCLCRLFPGLNRNFLQGVIRQYPSKEIHEIANIVIDMHMS